MPPQILDPLGFYVYALFREDGITVFYVGKGYGRRWKMHEGEANRGEKSYKANIIRQILKTLPSVPKCKLLENLTEEMAYQIETDLVQLIGRYPNGPLANRVAGGEGGRNPSADTREKMSASAKGKIVSEITRQRQSLARKGLKRTPEQRENYRAAMLRRPRETFERSAAKRRGQKQKTETKLKLAEAAKQQWANDRNKIIEAFKKRPKPSAAARAKMSESHKRRLTENPRKPMTEETKAKIRVARAKQAPLSEEARAKVSAALRARPPISEETRAKRRASVLAFIDRKKAELN